MRTKKLLWLFAVPVYFVLHVLRHEFSHAVADWLQMMQGSFLPRLTADGLRASAAFWDSSTSWMTLAMPFFSDLAVFLFFFYICMAVPFRRRWIWLNLAIVGMFSPLVNTGWHFITRSMNMQALYQILPARLVNFYFLATLALYITGILLVVFFSRTTLPVKAESSALD